MFSELYQSGERDYFIAQVKSVIAKDLYKAYRGSFISPWWRLVFKGALEKYIAKLMHSYQNAFPKMNLEEVVGPVERLITKGEWEAYLNIQSEKLARSVLQAEEAQEKTNVGYMMALNKSWDKSGYQAQI